MISKSEGKFGSLLELFATSYTFLKTFNSVLLDIEGWFTEQNSQPLETNLEDRISLSLVIKIKHLF